MPEYRFVPFGNEQDAATLENPRAPMPTGDCADIMEARTLAKATAEKAGADFVVIEDVQGNVVERWRRDDGHWKRFDA